MKWDDGGHFRQQEQHGPMMKARKSMAGSLKAKQQRSMTGLQGACRERVGNEVKECSRSLGSFKVPARKGRHRH